MDLIRNFRNILGNLAGRIWPPPDADDDGDFGQQQGQAPLQPMYVPAPDALPVFRGRRRSADWEVMLQEGVRMDTYEPGRNRRSRRVSRPPVRYQA